MSNYKDFSKRIIFHTPAMKEFRQDYHFVDMHVHTKYSHDCQTNLQSILKWASARNIGLAISDHNRAEGAIELAKQKKVMIIPAIEVTSMEKKEILLYFYSARDLSDFYYKHVKNRITVHKVPRTSIGRTLRAVKSTLKMSEIIDRAEEYNCLKSVPHPYNYFGKSSFHFYKGSRAKLLEKIEAVEVFNAAQRRMMNKRALKWAIKKKKAFTGGSDAHALREIGNAVTACRSMKVEEFLEQIRKNRNLIIGNETRLPAIMKILYGSFKEKRREGWQKLLRLQEND
jgi:predicted metal-dependent phosphoesterase TrpH